jgi:imidazolonepropionase-like amidohydrolase
MRAAFCSVALTFTAIASVAAQQPPSAQDPGLTVAERVATFRGPLIALTNVRLVDGTGARARAGQTIIINGRTIRAIGPTAEIPVPPSAQVIDLTGHTVIPGIIGLHDHMYYQMRPQLQSYPTLFLGAGVTTVRTTGSTDPYGELNLRAQVKRGQAVGPEVVVTGPYLQGDANFGGAMYHVSDAASARRVVRYWAEEGVDWFKAYTTITRENLAAAIDEAHKHNVKVTAHLCSVTFREAVALRIDALEHGYLTNSEYYRGKQPDVCPAVSDSVKYAGVRIDSPDVAATIRDMVRANVSLTSTLAIMELSSPSRVPFDQRVLDALHPDLRAPVTRYFEQAKTAEDSVARALLRQAMEFERAFVRAGGLLGAGSDPCCLSVIAGYGDQRNYELLVEAGFTGEEAIQIMTSNGARILGIADRVGTIQVGKQADLVIIAGDPTARPADIRNVKTVFKFGLGFDAEKLIRAVNGRVGFR